MALEPSGRSLPVRAVMTVKSADHLARFDSRGGARGAYVLVVFGGATYPPAASLLALRVCSVSYRGLFRRDAPRQFRY